MFKLESNDVKGVNEESESQDEVTTCRIQQAISEWLVDECM